MAVQCWAVILCLAAAACLVAAEALRKRRAANRGPGRRSIGSSALSCHGASGEGTAENYPRPLTGDRSLGQLAGFIEKSMPEDNPGTCVGDDAKNVAAYIYDAFYSPAARARNKPARVELSRLTVNQYANVVADLVGSFRERAPHDDPPGLKARYIARRREGRQGATMIRPSSRSMPRSISTSAPKVPSKGRIKPDEYQIYWRGACSRRRRASMSSIWKQATAADSGSTTTAAP